MKVKPLPNKKTEWRTCNQCGATYTAPQDRCENCSLSQSKPEFLAGIITVTIAVVALYFVFQL